MIVLDTSAALAVLLNEPSATVLLGQLASAERVLISAGTLAEMHIVAGRRGLSEELQEFLALIEAEIVPVTADMARAMKDAYRQWGKGFHPAGLNFGDCFAYALAKGHDLPLLFVGSDFSRTDIRVAMELS